MDKKREDLLDFIASEIGCDYLSDINLPVNKEAVKTVIKLLSEEDYSDQEWENAVRYINGDEFTAETREQAKSMILEYLETEVN